MFFEFNCKELFLKACVLLRFHRQKCAGEKHLLVGRNVRIRNVSFSIHKILEHFVHRQEDRSATIVHIPGIFFFFQISGRFPPDLASCCLEADMALVARVLCLPDLQVHLENL